MYLHNVYICDSMYGTVCISTRCATLCDLTHTQRPTGSLNPLSTEGPRGRGAGSYHWDPPSGDRWGQQPQAISASSDSVSLQVLVSPLRDFRSPAMLSLIDRHAGKVRVFWRIAGTPSPPYALAFSRTLHPRCTAAQPGWHLVPEESERVAKGCPAACVGKCIPNLSITSRLCWALKTVLLNYLWEHPLSLNCELNLELES